MPLDTHGTVCRIGLRPDAIGVDTRWGTASAGPGRDRANGALFEFSGFPFDLRSVSGRSLDWIAAMRWRGDVRLVGAPVAGLRPPALDSGPPERE